MRTYARVLAGIVVGVLAAGIAVGAQEKPKSTPIKLQITLSRYQGEKKISSLPYTVSLSVAPGPPARGNLRMGSKVPVNMMAAPVVDGQKMPAAGPVSYQDVGTNIDCFASVLDDGSYKIEITVEDTSVVTDDKPGKSEQPTFRSFKVLSSLNLKDGQTGQFTSAADKVSGEVTKIDVLLTVVK